MDSRKAYEMMKEEYVEREALELCNQIERQLERIISYDDGFLDNKTFEEIKESAIKLLKEWHL
jgi:aspartate/methionine/tyrosine aminotransferase